jgi:hypothetical protein
MGLRKHAKARQLVCLAFITAIAGSAAASLFSGVSQASGSLGNVGAWQTTTSLPVSRLSQTASVAYNHFAYLVGGVAGSSFTSTVYYAALNTDGSVGSWQTASNSLPTSLNNESAIAYNGYLYVLGGDANSGLLDSVYYARLNSDGSVGSWQTDNSLPADVANGAAVEANGDVYLIGGDNTGTLSSVYYAKLNSDGSVGAWQTAGNSLPAASEYATAVANNGYIYVVDGASGNPLVYAKANSDGSVGAWQTASNSPSFNAFQLATAANGYLFVVGTDTSFPLTSVVQSAPLNSDGSVGTWTASPNSIANSASMPISFAFGGFIYSMGGGGFFGSGDDAEYAPLNYTDQSSVNNSLTNKAVVVNVPQGDNITCDNATTESVQTHQDSGYAYPLGLTTFCFTTEEQTNTVSLTFVTNLSPSQVVARDYNPTTGQYVTIPGTTITQTTYNGSPALMVTYNITDGGALDADGLENQSITDPVGLGVPVAATNSVTAPDTGYGRLQRNAYWLLFIVSAVMLVLGVRKVRASL